MAQPKKRVLIRFNLETLEEIDNARGEIPRTRWIRTACKKAVEAQKKATKKAKKED